ncbi:hypothetical protein AAF712_013401 [Marasmius tenuissimus]|uniref:F-box domain-containing protein n=1 Tax=Marasmius tenuissimus TaxID=585030 RepID=A0ABR2ZER5_9AGAR
MHPDSTSAETNKIPMEVANRVDNNDEAVKQLTHTVQDLVLSSEKQQSYIEKIPNEILRDIFLGIPPAEDVFSVSKGPWVLTHVSRRWRQVSTATPGLWTKIKFNLDTISSSPRRMNGVLELFAMVLGRSTGTKRIVEIQTEKAPPEYAQLFLDILRSTRHTWVELTLQGIFTTGCQAGKEEMFGGLRLFPDRASGDTAGFDSLESVGVMDLVPYERRREFIAALEKAPNLRTVVVRGLQHARRADDPPPAFNWGKLKHLSLDWSCLMQDWGIRALKECVGLDALVLEGNPGRAPSSSGDTLIELKTITKLRVSLLLRYTNVREIDYPPHVCYILKLPALESLEIANPSCQPIDLEMIVGLVERSASSVLCTISIEDVFLSDITLGRLLRAAPQVTKLKMHGYVFPHVVNMIASGEILPNLEHLSIGCSKFAPALLHATRVAIVGLLEAKTSERLSDLQTLHVTDKQFDVRLELQKGEPVSSDILEKARVRVGLEDYRETGKIFNDLAKGLLFQDLDPACDLLNDNIELFEYMLTVMEDCEAIEFKYAFFKCSIPDLLVNSYMFWSLSHPSHPPLAAQGWSSIRARLERLELQWRAPRRVFRTPLVGGGD